MAPLPWMKFYPVDFKGETSHMTAEERGGYISLIAEYWRRGGPLPPDPQRLAIVAGIANERWTDVAPTLAAMFDVSSSGWRHEATEAQLEVAREKVEKAQKAGIASAKSRKDARDHTQSNGRSTDVEHSLNGRTPGVATPGQPTQTPERSELNSESDAARESVGDIVKGLVKGLGSEASPRTVSAETRRKVAAMLGLETVEPLLAIYWTWPGSKKARDPDKHFSASAARIFKNASPEVQKACGSSASEPELAKPIGRASPELRKIVAVEPRAGR